jgi:hypothetical protein
MTFAIAFLAFLALSILLEIVYPFDSDPDVLYQTTRSKLIRFLESSARLLIARLLIPMWNAASVYMIEPAILIMIEIVSLISTCNRELFFRVNETDTVFVS